ncbi:MAG: hypothetical protein NTW29_15405 [Bacteroidetes bacterium]|nr:hypothetical protein [Bacteroidota bacterium]
MKLQQVFAGWITTGDYVNRCNRVPPAGWCSNLVSVTLFRYSGYRQTDTANKLGSILRA